MEIHSKTEYEEFKSTLPKEFVEHPAFESACDFKVGDFLSNGHSLDVQLSDDKRALYIRTNVKVFRGTEEPHSIINGLDIKLEENGKLTCVQTYGDLYDAVTYYQRRPNARDARSFSQYDSLLSTSYYFTAYDKNGIVTATSIYSKYGWGLNNVRFDNEQEFRNQVFARGWHKPSEWYFDGRPKIPEFSGDAIVSGIVRDPSHPGLATTYVLECSPFGGIAKSSSYRGYVHGEWPDVLRVDHYEQFAEYKGGHWEVRDEYKHYYPGMSVEDLEKMFALQFADALEGSNTKEYGHKQYYALKEMTEKANQRYMSDGRKI